MNKEQEARLKQQMNFLLELDKMKNIYRQTYVLHEDRHENDAEHSWHLALLAIILSEYAIEQIDVRTVIETVLIHDIVEIDAGDTYAYDDAGNATKAEREQKAADRLYGLLPEDQGVRLRKLWEDFEAQSTPEARFAAALDRIQPLTLNYTKKGKSWKEHGTKRSQAENRMQAVSRGSAVLGEMAEGIIHRAVEEGLLKDE